MNDNINLLRECSAGIKTAVTSIDEILPFVKDEKLKVILQNSKTAHEQLEAAVDISLENSGISELEETLGKDMRPFLCVSVLLDNKSAI